MRWENRKKEERSEGRKKGRKEKAERRKEGGVRKKRRKEGGCPLALPLPWCLQQFGLRR